MHRAFAVAALFAVGCTSPAHWSVPLPALDSVPLSVAQPAHGTAWIVGGALGSGGNALVLELAGGRWQRLDPGTDATLWWVSSNATPWMVGERGTVLVGMQPVTVPTSATLYGVWVSPQGNAWLVGGVPDVSGVILRGAAGGAWQDVTPANTSGALFKVWGAADDDVWICGQNGTLLHWDGGALSSIDSGVGHQTLLTVAGRSADDVYAVGGAGSAVVLHKDANGWSRLSDTIFDQLPGLTGVSVDSDGSVAITGYGGTKLRGRPGAWTDDSALSPHVDLHGVSIAGGEIFAVGGNYLAPPPATREGAVGHFGGDVPSNLQ